jgi:hypothetical protein
MSHIIVCGYLISYNLKISRCFVGPSVLCIYTSCVTYTGDFRCVVCCMSNSSRVCSKRVKLEMH